MARGRPAGTPDEALRWAGRGGPSAFVFGPTGAGRGRAGVRGGGGRDKAARPAVKSLTRIARRHRRAPARQYRKQGSLPSVKEGSSRVSDVPALSPSSTQAFCLAEDLRTAPPPHWLGLSGRRARSGDEAGLAVKIGRGRAHECACSEPARGSPPRRRNRTPHPGWRPQPGRGRGSGGVGWLGLPRGATEPPGAGDSQETGRPVPCSGTTAPSG